MQYKPTGVPGKGTCVRPVAPPKPACGGLNQSSCWHVDPTKWCNTGLQYKPTGVPGKGTCVRPPVAPPKPACGGLNQSSCWHVDPTKWCNAGLQYKPTGVPGKGTCVQRVAKPQQQCGGLNQTSCWNIDPTKWCAAGLEYWGTGKPGEGRCIVPGSDATPNCGGENQSSCWNLNPKHWCDDGLSYVSGVIPNQGTCQRKLSGDEYKAAAKGMLETIKTLGLENPVSRLRNCLLVPDNLVQLQQVMKQRSKNGINQILSICGVAPAQLKAYGQSVMGHAPKTLQIGLSGGLVAGVGVEGSISYAISLENVVVLDNPNRPELRLPEARYFLTNGVGGGAGLAAGVDVTVGLTGESMPTEHWAIDKGKSVNFSGRLLGSVSVSIDFPQRGITPNGFTIGGGAGVGAEVGTLIHTRDQYLYNF